MSYQIYKIPARPMTIKRVTLWRGEIDGTPNALAAALQPLAQAGIRMQVFMRYRHFRDEQRAIVEVCPYSEEEETRCRAVMLAAGLQVSTVPAVILEGEPMPDFEYRFADLIAQQGLRLIFCVTQTVNDTWMALLGFESEADAHTAVRSLMVMMQVPQDGQPQTVQPVPIAHDTQE